MIFTPELIEKIIDNSKSQTRRLVKEGEVSTDYPFTFTIPDDNIPRESVCYFPKKAVENKEDSKLRIKWKVGRDYAVQSKRGGKGVWWSPETKEIKDVARGIITVKDKETAEKVAKQIMNDYSKVRTYVPLRILVTELRKEKLKNISNQDAIKEGFNNKEEFILYVQKLYNKNSDWNPDMWVLSFEVV